MGVDCTLIVPSQDLHARFIPLPRNYNLWDEINKLPSEPLVGTVRGILGDDTRTDGYGLISTVQAGSLVGVIREALGSLHQSTSRLSAFDPKTPIALFWH